MNLEKTLNPALSNLCSFKLSGQLNELITIHSLEELRYIRQHYASIFVLGKGSNTLINPNHHYDAIIKLSPKLLEPRVSNQYLTVSASTSVNKLMTLCKQYELSGLEFCAGVPASIGGMVTMNFGCWGKEISQLITDIMVMTPSGEIQRISNSECQFSYRSSTIKKEDWIVLSCTLKLTKSRKALVEKEIKDAITQRLQKQPLREATFGSIFKNPKTKYAAELIESAGLKGKQFDNITVSSKHANFLENTNNASYANAINAIQTIQKEVSKQNNIHLEPEVDLMIAT